MPSEEYPDLSDPHGSLPAHLAERVESIVRAAEREAAAVQREIEAQRQVAETEARRYLIDARRRVDAATDERMARLRRLTDELLERAETTRGQFDELISSLELMTTELEREREESRANPMEPDLGPRPSGAGSEESSARRPDTPPPPPEAGWAGGPAMTPSIQPTEPGQGGEASEQGRRPEPEQEPAQPPSVPPGDPPAIGGDHARLGAARLVALEMALAGNSREEVDRHLRDAFRVRDTAALLDDVFGQHGAGGRA